MNEATRRTLNAINQRFYETTVDHFDATRQVPWEGWAQIPEWALRPAPLRVLDVGCGNGRFGVWLAEQVPGLHYTGVDNNGTLLGYAQRALADEASALSLMEDDILTSSLPDNTYDLVVLFGVIHHVPGNAQRLDFMRALAERVCAGGVLVFAAWRFWDNERFQAKEQPWPPDLDREPGDYLLDWRRGTVARRYCHHVDDAEHDALVHMTGLEEVARFRADGADGRTNQYSVLRRTE